MLSVLFDADDWLGTEAKISGSLELRQANSSDWKARFEGEILDVDLARLVNQRFPRHRLTGKARITFEKAVWGQRPSGQGPGWIEVKGQLVAGAGSIGLNLFESLAQGDEIPARCSKALCRSSQARSRVPLAGAFVCDAGNGEIQITGALGAEFPPDAVLASSSSTLLTAPQGAASVHSLIKTLFPTPANNSGVLIPLTTESQVLLSLPLPAGATQQPAPPSTPTDRRIGASHSSPLSTTAPFELAIPPEAVRLCKTLAAISSAISGLSRRYCLAFSRPWPEPKSP